jgi:hypothetical protein
MKTLFIYSTFENVFTKANSLDLENIDSVKAVVNSSKIIDINIQITSKDSRQFKYCLSIHFLENRLWNLYINRFLFSRLRKANWIDFP